MAVQWEKRKVDWRVAWMAEMRVVQSADQKADWRADQMVHLWVGLMVAYLVD